MQILQVSTVIYGLSIILPSKSEKIYPLKHEFFFFFQFPYIFSLSFDPPTSYRRVFPGCLGASAWLARFRGPAAVLVLSVLARLYPLIPLC